MVKQTKTFKKGNVTKKALSAILAASMVMTSSSFVMAAPVEVEDVAVEAAAEVAVGAEETEAVEEAETAAEEKVGRVLSNITVTVTPGSTYNFGAEVRPNVTVKAKVDGAASATPVPTNEYSVAYSDNKEAGYGTVTVTFDQDVYQGQKPVTQTFAINKLRLNSGNTTIKVKDKPEGYVYTGEVQKPEIESIVVKNTADNTEHKYTAADCEVVAVAGSDMKSVGPQKYTIKMNNKNFTVDTDDTNMTFSIQISACEFKAGNVSVSSKTAPAGITVDEAKKYVVIKNQKGEVLDNSNFNIIFYDSTGKAVSTNLYKGSYTAEVSVEGGASGNYVGTAKLTTPFTVTGNVLEAAVEQAEIKVDTDYHTENNFGKPKKTADGYTIEYIGVEQYISKVTLPSSIDESNYAIDEATVTKGTNAGDVLTATIIGKNALAGESAVVSVKIVPRVIKESDFCDIYEESTATPQDDDWFKYKAVLGEKLDGSVSDNAIVNIKFWDYSETGSDKYTKNLEEGKDYSYTVDKSSQTIVLTGKGNFTTVNPDTKTDTISLGYHTEDKVQLGDPNIVVTVNGTYKYTGKLVTPTDVTVVDKTTGTATTLVKGQDYDLRYGNTKYDNIKAGKGVITIIPFNANPNCRYRGSKEVEFAIAGEDIANVAVVKDLKNVALTAPSRKQVPVVTFKNGNTVPSDGYVVKYYKNGKEVTSDNGAFASTGTITVEINGTNRYTGKITKTYNITGYDITSATVEEIKDQVYTGAAIEPEVKVTGQVDNDGKLVGSGGIAKIFIKGVDYTVEYSNNVEAGTAHVLIKGIGKYSGEIAKTFKITGVMNQNIEVLAAQERDLGNGSRTLNSKPTKIKYTAKTDVTFESSNEDVVTVDAEGNIKYTGLGEATITIKAAAQNGYEAATKELKVVVKLAKPSFTPFSKNNAFTLTSSTVKGAEKFEVEYATKKDFSNKKSKTFTATSGKVRQVKVSAGDKTTYYVRVRAISGTTKSAWSTVKTVATK